MLVGKYIWSVGSYEGIPFTTGPHLVLTVKQLLPAGVAAWGKVREQSLLDLFCEDGRRVLAVANIWSRNPEKASDPW